MLEVAQVIAWLKVAAVVGTIVVMLYGLNRVFCRLKAKNQGFGPNVESR